MHKIHAHIQCIQKNGKFFTTGPLAISLLVNFNTFTCILHIWLESWKILLYLVRFWCSKWRSQSIRFRKILGKILETTHSRLLWQRSTKNYRKYWSKLSKHCSIQRRSQRWIIEWWNAQRQQVQQVDQLAQITQWCIAFHWW